MRGRWQPSSRRKKITRIEGIRYDEGDLKRGCEARRKGEKEGRRKKGGE